MSLEQILVVVTLIVALGLMVTERIKPEVSALLIAVVFGLAQFAGLGVLAEAGDSRGAIRSISGFSQSVVITLISLFIITRSLEKSGLTNSLANLVMRVSGSSEARMIGLLAGSAAVLSLFMNNLAAGALVIPSALQAARQTGIRPSKLLIPVSFGTMLGGAATYFTTANIIVSDLLVVAIPPQSPLGVLDFTPTGGLVALVGIGFLAWFGPQMLPDRPAAFPQAYLRPTGRDLVKAYHIDERLWQARVRPNSPLTGKTLSKAAIGERLGLAVVALLRGKSSLRPTPSQVLLASDVLILIGREERMEQLVAEGLDFERYLSTSALSELGLILVEVMPVPRSAAEGKTLRELAFRRSYGFTAVALQRRGKSFRTNVSDFTLELGDSLLLVGAPERLARLRKTTDLIVLEPGPGGQPVRKREAVLTIAIVTVAIVVAAFGVPIYLSMLAGAVLILILGLLNTEEAIQAIDWPTIFLIAGMYALSLAMIQTSLADRIGDAIIRVVAPFGSLGLAAGSFLMSSLLTQIMGGQVTALITGPITISAAISLGANPQAVAVATAIGCSASFLTPLSHPVNIMVMGPAGYTFGDFFKIGIWLNILCFFVLLAGMILFWRF